MDSTYICDSAIQYDDMTYIISGVSQVMFIVNDFDKGSVWYFENLCWYCMTKPWTNSVLYMFWKGAFM